MASNEQTLSNDHSRILLVQHAASLSGSTFSGGLIAKSLRKTGYDVHVAFGFNGTGIDLFRELGCHTHVIQHKNWLRGGNLQRSARRIAAEVLASSRFVKLIRQIQPDVVYVNSLVSLAGAVAAKRCGLPCIWHIRELFEDQAGEMISPAFGGRWLVRKLLKELPDEVVIISRAAGKNVLGEQLLQRAKVIPNAVNDDYFDFLLPQIECRQKLNLPINAQIIGVPGTLRPVKGHQFFFDAASLLLENHPECQFAVSGDGDSKYKQKLQDQIDVMGIRDRTHFTGTLADMREFYRACDVICVPSESESFGRTVIEAFAIGTPVVSTAVGGIKEIIENKSNGLLVPYGNIPALFRALSDLLARESHCDQLVANAMDSVESRFRESNHHQEILEVVESVLAVESLDSAGAS